MTRGGRMRKMRTGPAESGFSVESRARRHGRGMGAPALLAGIALFVAFAAVAAAQPVNEYQKRQATLDKELAADHYALGLWCETQKLFNEAREEFERVLSLQPTHRGAAQKLGEPTKVSRRAKHLTCEFHLANGDRMKGELLLETLKVQTPSGLLVIPVSGIDLIRLGQGQKPDRVISDGYVGEGRVQARGFSARSKVGALTVKREDVTSLRILRPCDACEGKGETMCRRCRGTGRLREKSVCPDCGGKGTSKCGTCDGTGRITCPLCVGKGKFSGAWGRLRRARCPRCNGVGKVDCPDCAGKGGVVCPTCKGTPETTHAGPCPVCTGKGVVKCSVCGGTAVKPLPKTEPGEKVEKATEDAE